MDAKVAERAIPTAIFDTEKAIKELGDKVNDDTKSKVEEAKEELLQAMKGDDLDAMKKALGDFQQASQTIGEMAYQQVAEEQAKNQADNESSESSDDDDNVVDVDYEEVEDDKKD